MVLASQQADADDLFESEFEDWKQGYYREKLHVAHADEAFLREQSRTYIAGLQWVLFYYYCGVPDWGWYALSTRIEKGKKKKKKKKKKGNGIEKRKGSQQQKKKKWAVL